MKRLSFVTLAVLALFAGTANASLDRDFGHGGLFRLPAPGASQSAAFDLARQANGRLLLGGWEAAPRSFAYEPIVVRLSRNGRFDTSYGDGGVVRFGDESLDAVQAISLARDGGAVVVIRSSAVGGVGPLTLARLTNTGELDASFGGGDGIVDTGIRSFGVGAPPIGIAYDDRPRIAVRLREVTTVVDTLTRRLPLPRRG